MKELEKEIEELKARLDKLEKLQPVIISYPIQSKTGKRNNPCEFCSNRFSSFCHCTLGNMPQR